LVTVFFIDVVPPVLTVPAAITLEATEPSTIVNIGTARATDNVNVTVIPTHKNHKNQWGQILS